ncbi:MAG: Holliday junction resolvase RuvX [Planctomycetota bacterium]
MTPPSRGAVLAIDHGERRTGLAVVDPLRIAARALEVVEAPEDGLLRRIAQLCEERVVSTFLVGLPLDAQGKDGGRAASVRAFAARLSARFPGVELVFHDERLTSKEADLRLVEAGHAGRARKERRDAWAALVLLQDWLESGEPR